MRFRAVPLFPACHVLLSARASSGLALLSIAVPLHQARNHGAISVLPTNVREWMARPRTALNALEACLWPGIVFVVLGGVLVGIGAATDSGTWAFGGWVDIVASVILVVMGSVARGAAK